MHITHKEIVKNQPIEKLPPIYQEEIKEQFNNDPNWIYDGQFFSLIEEIATGKRRWYASFKQRGAVKRPQLTINIPTKEEPKEPRIPTDTKKGLRVWNGRGGLYEGRTSGRHINIAAKTKKDAAILLIQAYELEYSIQYERQLWNEIHNYFAECWGNDMHDIIPNQPGVWLTGGESGPEKIV